MHNLLKKGGVVDIAQINDERTEDRLIVTLTAACPPTRQSSSGTPLLSLAKQPTSTPPTCGETSPFHLSHSIERIPVKRHDALALEDY